MRYIEGGNITQIVFWNNLFDSVSILPFDINCSLEAVKIYKQLRDSNKIIDLADILIAATAISNKIPIATLNIEHFSRINGLIII